MAMKMSYSSMVALIGGVMFVATHFLNTWVKLDDDGNSVYGLWKVCLGSTCASFDDSDMGKSFRTSMFKGVVAIATIITVVGVALPIVDLSGMSAAVTKGSGWVGSVYIFGGLAYIGAVLMATMDKKMTGRPAKEFYKAMGTASYVGLAGGVLMITAGAMKMRGL